MPMSTFIVFLFVAFLPLTAALGCAVRPLYVGDYRRQAGRRIGHPLRPAE